MSTVIDLIEVPIEGVGSISAVQMIQDPKTAVNEGVVERAVDGLVTGRYSIQATNRFVRMCGDGRFSGKPLSGGQLFGATPGFVKSLRLAGEFGDADHASEDVKSYIELFPEIMIGAHRADTHGNRDICGCGECDAADIAANLAISDMSEEVRTVTKTLADVLNISFDSSTYQEVVAQYRTLQRKGYFLEGRRAVETVEEALGDEQTVEILDGGHKEVIWVINTIEDTVFDRQRFASDFAENDLQAFWEDQWLVKKQALESGVDEGSIPKLLVADLMRRSATALALTKNDLKLIILSK